MHTINKRMQICSVHRAEQVSLNHFVAPSLQVIIDLIVPIIYIAESEVNLKLSVF